MSPEGGATTGRSVSGPDERNVRRGSALKLYGSALLAAALVAVVVVLIVVNSESVRLDWLFGSTEAPLALVIFLSAVAGWLVGLATAHLVRRRARRRP